MKKFKIILVIIIIVAAIFFGMKYGILNKRQIEKTAKKVLKKTEEVTGVRDIEKKIDKAVKEAKKTVDKAKDFVEEGISEIEQ